MWWMDVTDQAGCLPDDGFVVFAGTVSAPLLHALVAVFGPDVGRDAALDALAWGWEHWDRLERMRNPAGYLYRVGTTAGRRTIRHARRVELRASVGTEIGREDPFADRELAQALARLSPRQRAAVVMVVGHAVPLREAARLLGCSVSSLRNHVERALRHLRQDLEDDHAHG